MAASALGGSITVMELNKNPNDSLKLTVGMAPLDNDHGPFEFTSKHEIDFSRLRDERRMVSDIGLRFVNQLESALKLPPTVSVDEKAKHFVAEVVEFSPTQQSELGPDGFVWELWVTLIEVSAQVPPYHSAQDVLCKAVILLDTIGDSEETEKPMWKDLSSFTMAIRDHWNRAPIPQARSDDDTTFTDSEWLNLNSFIARLYAANVLQAGAFPIWELRSGLETSLSSEVKNETPANIRVRVASEWIIQSAPRILHESLLRTYSDVVEGESTGRPFRGGPLYSGESGFSVERWCFWKRRFQELKTEVDLTLLPEVNKAVELMVRAEKELGELAKSIASRVTAKEDEAESASNGSRLEDEDHTGDEDNTEKECDIKSERSMEHEDHIQRDGSAEDDINTEHQKHEDGVEHGPHEEDDNCLERKVEIHQGQVLTIQVKITSPK
ncbi:hypothetical protein M434DRAFT_397307 [Hypoxylon sp. CO27-5]|nr:hypothetical protein M434DRAFT_397307 [Hypoxylon sp. CO27-5]